MLQGKGANKFTTENYQMKNYTHLVTSHPQLSKTNIIFHFSCSSLAVHLSNSQSSRAVKGLPNEKSKFSGEREKPLKEVFWQIGKISINLEDDKSPP